MLDDDALIDYATKDDLVDCAKLLAVAVALYRRRFGDLDLGVAPGTMEVVGVHDAVAEELSAATRTFLDVLGEIVQDNRGQMLH